MGGRLGSLYQIARLRREGFSLPWSAQLRLTAATRIDHGIGCGMGPGSILHAEDGELILGDLVNFGPYNYVAAAECRIEIGSRLLCSPFVSVIGLNHRRVEGVVRWGEHDHATSGITIGNDCWLATNSVILPGVRLGDRCVVAAGAVVTKSFQADSVLVGVPARLASYSYLPRE